MSPEVGSDSCQRRGSRMGTGERSAPYASTAHEVYHRTIPSCLPVRRLCWPPLSSASRDMSRAIVAPSTEARHVLGWYLRFVLIRKGKHDKGRKQNRAMLTKGPRRTDGCTAAAQASPVHHNPQGSVSPELTSLLHRDISAISPLI
jgi:hypothetical protein